MASFYKLTFVLFVYYPVVITLNGWVLSILWGWFAVPTFGLPTLSIPAAVGTALTVGFITQSVTAKRDEDETKNLVAVGLKPFFSLLVGYIIHRVFM